MIISCVRASIQSFFWLKFWIYCKKCWVCSRTQACWYSSMSCRFYVQVKYFWLFVTIFLFSVKYEVMFSRFLFFSYQWFFFNPAESNFFFYFQFFINIGRIPFSYHDFFFELCEFFDLRSVYSILRVFKWGICLLFETCRLLTFKFHVTLLNWGIFVLTFFSFENVFPFFGKYVTFESFIKDFKLPRVNKYILVKVSAVFFFFF